MKKILSILIIILMLVGTSIIPITSSITHVNQIKKIDEISSRLTMEGDILYVGGSGPGNYSTIMSAISYANEGDTVFVYSGTYYEGIFIPKKLNLIGENKYSTIIDAGIAVRENTDIRDTVKINADGVKIANFTLRNCGTSAFDAGVHVDDYDNVTIMDNIIKSNHRDGIIVGLMEGFYYSNRSSSNHTICNNIIESNDVYGIMLCWVDYSNIFNNTIRYNGELGIWAQYCDSNNITGNFIYNNSGRGIDFYNCSYNNISWNYFFNNGLQDNRRKETGICLRVRSHYNIIWGNFFSKHHFGLFIPYECNYNLVVYNEFVHNNIGINYGKPELITTGNMFYHNNFVDNIVNAYDVAIGTSFWDNGYPSGGNYWDDYDGEDNNDDGFGDTPYYIQTNGTDNYPLMEPWNLPPYIPNSPNPYNGETMVPINTNLTWNGGDKNPGDTVTYDIYFGKSNPPPKVISNHSSTRYILGGLNWNTTYYWKIIAWDRHNMSAQGPLWYFNTRGNSPPEVPFIYGKTSGKTGRSYDFTFNSVDSDEDDIYYYIDWGDNTSTGWLGPYISGMNLKLKNIWNKEGTYTIRCKAKDIYNSEGPWGELVVTMPRFKNMFYSVLWRFLEHFPLLQKILTLT